MKTQPEPEYRHGSPARVGVLLVNLGTPDAPTAPATLCAYRWARAPAATITAEKLIGAV